MARSHEEITVAIDVGTTKVCTIIAELYDGGVVQVAGVGVSPSKGLHKGLVVNMNEARRSIRESVKKAEETTDREKDAKAEEAKAETATAKPEAAEKAEEKGADAGKEKETEKQTGSGEEAKTAEAAEKEEEKKPKWKPHVGESEVPLNVIVVADADMLSNSFWVQIRQFLGRRFQIPAANNGDFVLNAVENLSGSNDLISLRSRGSAQRPFTRIERMQQAAQEQYKAEEQRLLRKMQETEKKLQELQGAGKPEEGGEAPKTLTPEQKAEVEKFTEELLTTRKALRQVRHNLRKDIDALRNRLNFVNIALVPILVTVVAAGLGAARVRRRRRSVSQD